VKRVYVYKLKPTVAQAVGLQRYLDVTREVYNAALEQRITAYRYPGPGPGWYAQKREIKELRADGLIDGVHVHPLQDALKRLDLAYQAFFRRCKQRKARKGFPRFKGVRHWRSFTFQEWGNGVSLKDGRLKISKIGSVRVRQHRPLVGAPKMCSIVHHPDGWFVHIVCHQPDVLPVPDVDSSQRAALDVGVVHLATLHTGEHIENIRPLKCAASKLRAAQKALARCKRGSKRRAKQRGRVAHAYLKLTRVRRDHLHKQSRRLADQYLFVAVEDLTVAAMTRSATGRGIRQKAGLNRSILDASWSELVAMISYKLEQRGGSIVKVNARYTSQTCPHCGCVDRESRLSQALFACTACGHEANADHVGAQNVYQRAWAAPVAEAA
jgi:putative transposase